MGYHTSCTNRSAHEVCEMARFLIGQPPGEQHLWGPVWWQAFLLADQGDRVPLEYLCQLAHSTNKLRWDKGPNHIPARKHLAGERSPLWLYMLEAWATMLTHLHAQERLEALDDPDGWRGWLLRQAPFLDRLVLVLNKRAGEEPRRSWAKTICLVASGEPLTLKQIADLFSLVKSTSPYTWVRFQARPGGGLWSGDMSRFDPCLMFGPRLYALEKLRSQNWITGGLIRHLIQRGNWQVESPEITRAERARCLRAYAGLLHDPWDLEHLKQLRKTIARRSLTDTNLGAGSPEMRWRTVPYGSTF